MEKFILVLTTVPSKKTGHEIARVLVGERLAACVTQSSACQSLYWWKDNISQDEEYMLYIKTKSSLYSELEEKIRELHPYEVPEIIALPFIKGHNEYLRWIDRETKG
ncbi:MAG: divalent-cation tolerance protein CutA [Candidatus Aminicenantaceae bacterium]